MTTPPTPPPPPAAPASPPPVQQAPPSRRGIPWWGWLAMGCGALVLVSLVVLVGAGYFVAKKASEVAEDFDANPAMTAAKLIVRASPELELIDSDDEDGTLTIRNSETGEVVTVDIEDLNQGRISWETDDGPGGISISEDEGIVIEGTDDDGQRNTMTIGADEEGIVMTSPDGTARIGGGGADYPSWVPVPSGISPESNFSASQTGGRVGMFSFEPTGSIDEAIAFYKRELESAGYTLETASINASGSRQETIAATNASESRTINVMANESAGKRQVVIQYEDKR